MSFILPFIFSFDFLPKAFFRKSYFWNNETKNSNLLRYAFVPKHKKTHTVMLSAGSLSFQFVWRLRLADRYPFCLCIFLYPPCLLCHSLIFFPLLERLIIYHVVFTSTRCTVCNWLTECETDHYCSVKWWFDKVELADELHSTNSLLPLWVAILYRKWRVFSAHSCFLPLGMLTECGRMRRADYCRKLIAPLLCAYDNPNNAFTAHAVDSLGYFTRQFALCGYQFMFWWRVYKHCKM